MIHQYKLAVTFCLPVRAAVDAQATTYMTVAECFAALNMSQLESAVGNLSSFSDPDFQVCTNVCYAVMSAQADCVFYLSVTAAALS
jgi:hypothetical protein